MAVELAVDPPQLRAGAKSALSQDLATVSVLVRRDLLRFFREKPRLVGALLQPLVFWLVIGMGFAPTFRLAGAEGLGYLEFFYPGIVLMVVLFAAIFTTMSVIDDRHEGFLQAVLVAPGSRTALVLGKVLGSSAVALAQGALFLLLAPAAGFSLLAIGWPLLIASLTLVAIALTATGFTLAWWLDSSSSYHVVMGMLLIPLWILSGAMFPAARSVPMLAAVMKANPIAYAVDAMRLALYGQAAPAALGLGTAWVDLAVVALFAAVALGAAVTACHRSR